MEPEPNRMSHFYAVWDPRNHWVFYHLILSLQRWLACPSLTLINSGLHCDSTEEQAIICIWLPSRIEGCFGYWAPNNRWLVCHRYFRRIPRCRAWWRKKYGRTCGRGSGHSRWRGSRCPDLHEYPSGLDRRKRDYLKVSTLQKLLFWMAIHRQHREPLGEKETCRLLYEEELT